MSPNLFRAGVCTPLISVQLTNLKTIIWDTDSGDEEIFLVPRLKQLSCGGDLWSHLLLIFFHNEDISGLPILRHLHAIWVTNLGHFLWLKYGPQILEWDPPRINLSTRRSNKDCKKLSCLQCTINLLKESKRPIPNSTEQSSKWVAPPHFVRQSLK